MVSTRDELLTILGEDAAASEGVSELTARLLNEQEIDAVSGAIVHFMSTGGGAHYTQAHEPDGTYYQTGGVFNQASGSFSQESGEAVVFN